MRFFFFHIDEHKRIFCIKNARGLEAFYIKGTHGQRIELSNQKIKILEKCF